MSIYVNLEKPCKIVYVFGDSHTMYFLGDRSREHDVFYEVDHGLDLKLRVMKLSSTGATMYGLRNAESESGARVTVTKAFSDENIENAIFVLGEVDCREHVRQKLTSQQIIENIQDILHGLEEFLSSLPLKNNVKFSFYAVNPPSELLISSRNSEDFSRWNFSVAKFNSMLEKFCDEKGFGFISTYRESVNDLGFVKNDLILSDGLMNHLDPKFLNEIIIRKIREIYVKD